MASKTNTKSKTADQEKNITDKKNEQMLLIRDESSQVLMIVEAAKVSSLNKVSKLTPGITVTWQSNARERWRGQILYIGSESECSKAMDTIEKNLESSDTNVAQSKKKEKHILQSTITIEPTASEHMQVDEEQEDEHQRQLHITDQEENEPELISIVPATTDKSTISTTVRGEKRTAEENFDSPDQRKNKRSKTGLTVPYSLYSEKQQECLALEAQVATFKQEWMPRPRDPKVIQYFAEVTNILTGRDDNDEEEDEEMETVFNNILTSLNMTEQQLKSCHGKTATSTARHIMKYKYPHPEPDFKFNKIGVSIIESIIRYVRIANPIDRTPDADIKHAMGNYIAAYLFKNKPKKNVSSEGVLEEANKSD